MSRWSAGRTPRSARCIANWQPGVKVPNGFAITAEAYRYFLRETGVDAQIRDVLRDLDTRDIENLRSRGIRVRHAILAAELPQTLSRRSPRPTLSCRRMPSIR